MESLFDVIERHRGGDGRPAVFTAFYSTANPDYDAIEKSDFTKYHDIPIDRGWSQGWESDGAMAAARAGMERGVFYPEYHARLHHSSPHLWLEILRGGHEDTDVFRMLFENRMYEFNRHLPEYERMAIREQLDWISEGIATFERAFDMPPRCAINSDGIPGTEESWALCGIRARSLKSVVLNDGRQVRPYGKLKPDGTMDGTTPMGRYNRFLDMTYLNRNAFFEVAHRKPGVLDDAYRAILGCWERGEPAVVSTHRLGYCSLVEDTMQYSLEQLDALLARFGEEHSDVVYMTSWEVAQLCHTGTSAIRHGDRWVLRNYGSTEATVTAPADLTSPATDLRTGRRLDCTDGSPGTYNLPPGDYEVEAGKA